MNSNWIRITGKVVQGHRAAGQPSENYPFGTIAKQKPIFKKLGLSLEGFFEATVNISIAPKKFEITHPQYTFENVEWTDLHPPETFSFSGCRIIFKGNTLPGWIYYPHHETKQRHYQDKSVIEVITNRIPKLDYQDLIELEVNSEEVIILGG